MPARRDSRELTLRDLIDLECQLAEDEAADPDALRRRDRAIGRELPSISAAGAEHWDRRALFLGWLERVRGGARPPAGVAAGRALVAIHSLLWVLGLATGIGTASAVLHYDGTRPVNVALALVVLVGAQWLLLALLALASIPRRWRSRLPGVTALAEALALLSPGRWIPALARLLPITLREPLQRALGRLSAHDRLYAPIRNWSIVGAAQGFAVAFNVGALSRMLLLVAFTDLSFGWSTTLEVGPESFHRWTQALSAPWSAVLPEAVPDRELVEATRYFRLDHGFAIDADQRARIAALSGRWWSFLAAALLVYGLVPRLLLLALARWRLAANLRTVGLDHHGFEQLRERLIEEIVETRALEPDERRRMFADSTNGGLRAAPQGTSSQGSPLGSPGAIVLLRFGQIALDDAAIARCLRGSPAVARSHAVGGTDVAADERVFVELAKGAGPATNPSTMASTILVACKAFEPPTRDFAAFLRRLRSALGDRRWIQVLPVDWGPDGAARAPEAADLDLWQRRVAAIGDPWLGLASPAQAVAKG